jgi:hypothetical protein
MAEIEEQTAAENRAIVAAKQECERHYNFAMTSGDAHAMAAVQRARSSQHEAEQRLAALLNLHWPAARQSLEAAEQAAANARRALAKPHIEALKRQCVAEAARMDEAFAEAEAAHERRQRYLLELQSWAQDGDGGMVSRHEDRVGLRRIYSALPAFMRSLPTNPTAKFIPLAESERQFWQLPPEQPAEKAKAA